LQEAGIWQDDPARGGGSIIGKNIYFAEKHELQTIRLFE